MEVAQQQEGNAANPTLTGSDDSLPRGRLRDAQTASAESRIQDEEQLDEEKCIVDIIAAEVRGSVHEQRRRPRRWASAI